jgi:hypothetical protein
MLQYLPCSSCCREKHECSEGAMECSVSFPGALLCPLQVKQMGTKWTCVFAGLVCTDPKLYLGSRSEITVNVRIRIRK